MDTPLTMQEKQVYEQAFISAQNQPQNWHAEFHQQQQQSETNWAYEFDQVKSKQTVDDEVQIQTLDDTQWAEQFDSVLKTEGTLKLDTDDDWEDRFSNAWKNAGGEDLTTDGATWNDDFESFINGGTGFENFPAIGDPDPVTAPLAEYTL